MLRAQEARDELALLEVGSDLRDVALRGHVLFIPWQCHVLRDHVWRFLRSTVVRRLAVVSKAWRYLAIATWHCVAAAHSPLSD